MLAAAQCRWLTGCTLPSTRAWKRRPLTVKTAAEINALRRELRAAKYDAVVDLQGAIRSAAIVRLAGCPRRIGEAKPREWPAQWLFTERVRTRGAHVIEQDVELASAVAGDALTPAEPLLPVDPEAESWCERGLRRRSVRRTAAHRAHRARRRMGRQALAARALRGGRGGSEAARIPRAGERCPGRRIAGRNHHGGGAAVPLTTTLPQLIALTRRIALCIAGDTGPLHLACALGRPVVGIYGPTDPSRNGPFGTRARVLRSPGSRRDHSRRDRARPRPADHRAGRRAACRGRTAGRGARRMISTPLLQEPAPRSGGKRWRGAFACRWAFLPRRFISSRWRAAHRILPPLRGAWRWLCPAWRCAPPHRAR